jgi:hypothetical protein
MLAEVDGGGGVSGHVMSSTRSHLPSSVAPSMPISHFHLGVESEGGNCAIVPDAVVGM